MDGCGETKYYTNYQYDEVTYPYTTGDYQQVVKLKDRKGQTHTSYYDSRGRLTGTGGSQPATSISYDVLGRKTSITDPNTGITTYTYYDSGQVATQTDARNITITYNYDPLNRLISEQSSDGTVDVGYFYDTGSTSNLKSRLYRVTDATGETIFSYDGMGLVTQYIKGIDVNGDGAVDKQFAVAMTYDYQRRLASTIYPDPDHTVVKMHYADAGYLKAVTDAGNNAFVQYTREAGSGGSLCSINAIKRITGNGVTNKITYDPATLRPTSILTTRPDDTVLENLEYTTYDKMGNITKITDLYPNDPNDNNIDDTETFTYDPINRLTKAVSAGLYGTHDFIYSASGSLTSKEGLALTYGDSAHPHAVTAYDGKTYLYGANGNMTSRNGKTYVYDAKSRLILVMNGGTIEERYFYDYSGFRAGKILADGTMILNLNGLYELRQIPGQTLFKYTNFIYGMDGDLIAQIIGETTWEAASIFPISKNMYNWKNFKGFFLKLYASASAWLEKPDNVRHVYWFLFGLAVVAGLDIWAYNVFFRRKREIIIPRWMAHAIPALLVIFFASFGLTGCFESLFPNATVDGVYYFHPNHVGSVKLITNQSGGIVARYKYTPYGELLTDKSSGTDVSKYKYTAQEEDSTTGLYNYNSRFYDPDTGRFITPDCIVPDPTNTQAFNRYMYVNGNPVNWFDTFGQWGISISVGGHGITISDDGIDYTSGGGTGVSADIPIVNNLIDHVSGSVIGSAIGTAIGGLLGIPGAEILGGIAGGLLGGTTGLNAGEDWIKEKAKDAKDTVKDWTKDQWDNFTDWTKAQWNVWIKPVLCIIAIVILIVVSVYLWYLSSWNMWWIAPLIGTLAGVAYGGTNGGKGGWSWEGAVAGAAVGFAIGCVVAYLGPSFASALKGMTMLESAAFGGVTSYGMALIGGERDPKKLGFYFAVGAAFGCVGNYLSNAARALNIYEKGGIFLFPKLCNFTVGKIIEEY